MSQFIVEWKKEENTRLLEGKSLVFHCHHYNCHLQKTIDDVKVVDGKGIQINAARQVAYEHFKKAFSNHPELTTNLQKLEFAGTFFKTAGFGLIDFKSIGDVGGIVRCPSSHYAKGWVTKWGVNKNAICHFNVGWIAGVLAAVYSKEMFYYDVHETSCEATGQKGCEYVVRVR